jgi:transposase-like protein
VDFLLAAKRDVAAAKRFFQKAMNGNGTPRVITLDAYAASHRALRELNTAGKMLKGSVASAFGRSDTLRPA